MTRRIAFINEKGGTGKTTLAVNVAAYLAQKKKCRVLLVDLDTQGHAGKILGIDARSSSPNVFHLLVEPGLSLGDVTRPSGVPNLFVVPSWKEMADFPLRLSDDPRRAERLASRLSVEAVAAYDVVVIDSPPSMGLVTTNVLLAAEEVVVPVATTYLSLDGCAELVETVERVRRDHGHEALGISLVVPTLYRKTALADEIVEKLHQYFPRRVAAPLGFNVAIDAAQSHAKTIWEHAPSSRGAAMLQAIAESVHRRRVVN